MSERAAARALPRRGADHQPARRHRAAARARRRAAASSTSRPTRCSCRSSCTTASPRRHRVPRAALRAFFTLRREPRQRPTAACRSSERFRFRPTRQPVVLRPVAGTSAGAPQRDASRRSATGASTGATSTLRGRDATAGARTREWQQLPRPAARAPAQRFELALSSYEPADREQLEAHGWAVRHALDFDRRDDYRATSPARAASSPSPRSRTCASQRLVQRPQRHLPRRRPARDHAGHRLRRGAADRRGPVRRHDARRGGRGGRGDRGRLRAPPPRGAPRSRASTSTRRACSATCSTSSGSPTHDEQRRHEDARAHDDRDGPAASAERAAVGRGRSAGTRACSR